ncbi:MAG TPA: AbrB/MazE/SpoVT family DNA-binding domain-containing protein [Nitrospinota bacterium]|mgnify:CR=1 FL=1|jgi:AbrB family looped-hinge helix DNA binding protein|nr:AbrB/MazE/SpoVT family DNA-binding domain-containing protein [Nitrospinota bacterium]|tara:strand:+ start:331 stop:564 length:234 start_codon:yes stop_codon:yes gene_type:complete
MSFAAKITSKGQVTIPKKIRDRLNSNVVEFKLVKNNIVIKPVESVSGALSKYAKRRVPFKKARDLAWEKAAHDKTGK